MTRRTVRFYVQRGVLDPPEGAGRGSYYTEKHLERLKEIKKLSEQGVPVMLMRDVLEGKLKPAEKDDAIINIQTTPWERCSIAQGIELHFRPGKLTVDELMKIQEYIKDLLGSKDND